MSVNGEHTAFTIVGIFFVVMIAIGAGYGMGKGASKPQKLTCVVQLEKIVPPDTVITSWPISPDMVYSCGLNPDLPLCWQVRKFIHETKGVYQDSAFYKYQFPR